MNKKDEHAEQRPVSSWILLGKSTEVYLSIGKYNGTGISEIAHTTNVTYPCAKKAVLRFKKLRLVRTNKAGRIHDVQYTNKGAQVYELLCMLKSELNWW